MKFDLVTSIFAAIAGIIVAYLATNFFVPPLTDVSFKNLETKVTSSLDQPNEEIFNYRAVNPTVEVYVGQCLEYNEMGECIDDSFEDVKDESDEESEENTSSDDSSGGTENGATN